MAPADAAVSAPVEYMCALRPLRIAIAETSKTAINLPSTFENGRARTTEIYAPRSIVLAALWTVTGRSSAMQVTDAIGPLDAPRTTRRRARFPSI